MCCPTLESRLQGFKTGADAYLNKPFNVEELHIRIEKLIELRKLLQQRYQGEGVTKLEGETANQPQYSSLDQALIVNLYTYIEKELSNEELEVDKLAREVGMSHSQLYRKIKALTNLSIAGFIRDYRLQRALEMLKTGEHNVSEVAYLTGFNSRNYFSKAFTQKYSYPPSEVAKV